MSPSLLRSLQLAVLLLMARVLWLIMAEYRWYFPPDFEQSSFLTGREETFVGLYAASFYIHILCGPITIVLATAQQFFPRGRWHPVIGRMVAGLVLLGVVPSGIVMASGTLFGPLAQYAFSAHALFTLLCCVQAFRTIRAGRTEEHRRWAQRLLAFLYAPLLFRLVTGVAILFDFESPTLHVLNAWACWIVPCCALECYRRTKSMPSLIPSKKHEVITCLKFNVAYHLIGAA